MVVAMLDADVSSGVGAGAPGEDIVPAIAEPLSEDVPPGAVDTAPGEPI